MTEIPLATIWRPNRRGVGSAVMAVTVLFAGVPAMRADSCPPDMVAIEDFCIDRYEAPNREAALPLVMYTFYEAVAWCEQRERRLCFDDEWTRACEGVGGSVYPYGDTHIPGVCNDEEIWRPYNQSLLNQWPAEASSPDVTSLQGLLDAARAVSPTGQESADHVEFLYQGEASGSNAGCVSTDGVLDLCGNIEEWTRRRDGGTTDFSGSLKGRYWAETRTCQQAINSHGNAFRFYQIAFRCCSDPTVDDPIFSDGFESGNLSMWSVAVP